MSDINLKLFLFLISSNLIDLSTSISIPTSEFIGCFNDGADNAKFSTWGYNGGPSGGNYKYFFSKELSDGNNNIWLTKDECITKALSDGYKYVSLQNLRIINGNITTQCYGGNNTDYNKYGVAPSCATTTNPASGYSRCCTGGFQAILRGNGDCVGLTDMGKYTRETTLEACQERCANEALCSGIMYTTSCNGVHGGELCVLYSGSSTPTPNNGGCAQCFSVVRNFIASTRMRILKETFEDYSPFDSLNNGVIEMSSLDKDDPKILNGGYTVNTRAVTTSNRFGKSNKAYLFDGGSSFIQTSITFPLFALSKSFSVWFSISTLKRGWIVAGGLDTADSKAFGLFLSSANGELLFHANGATCDYHFHTFSSSSLNIWQHVVISYDGNTISAYMNGILIGTKACVINTASSFVKLGIRQEGNQPGNNQVFGGKIDDFIAYNRSLTAEEATKLFVSTIVPEKRIYGGGWTGAVYSVIPRILTLYTVLEFINNKINDITVDIRDEINNQISNITAEMNIQISSINVDIRNEINKQISNITAEMNIQISNITTGIRNEINSQISNITALMNSQISNITAVTNSQISNITANINKINTMNQKLSATLTKLRKTTTRKKKTEL